MRVRRVEELSSGQSAEIKSLTLAVHLNMALCHFKQNKYDRVIDDCNKALQLEPNSVKALFRRGQGESFHQIGLMAIGIVIFLKRKLTSAISVYSVSADEGFRPSVGGPDEGVAAGPRGQGHPRRDQATQAVREGAGGQAEKGPRRLVRSHEQGLRLLTSLRHFPSLSFCM